MEKFASGDLHSSGGDQRNWAFATNRDFLISISLQPNVVDLKYFKL